MSPIGFYNGMISGHRNMFLSSSVAVIMIGLSNKFKDNTFRLVMKSLSSVIFLLSIFIAYKTNEDFLFYLDNVNKEEIPGYINLESWRMWPYIGYTYAFILTVIALLFIYRRIVL